MAFTTVPWSLSPTVWGILWRDRQFVFQILAPKEEDTWKYWRAALRGTVLRRHDRGERIHAGQLLRAARERVGRDKHRRRLVEDNIREIRRTGKGAVADAADASLETDDAQVGRVLERLGGNIAHARVDVEAVDARERAERDATRRNGICRKGARDAIPSLHENGASPLSRRHRKLHRLHYGVREKTDGIPVRRPQRKRTKQHKQQRQYSHADIISQPSDQMGIHPSDTTTINGEILPIREFA